MDIAVEPGRYVVAVSGGIDSVALLDMLTKLPGLQLTVAHYDHGIREDSHKDREHVRRLAKSYGLPFVYDLGGLGAGTSEATARAARYRFLHTVREANKAQAVITAHHQDDLLETIILNLLRGTGSRGLSSLKSTEFVRRPLLHLPKQALRAYSLDQGLLWREDSTNTSETYLRNYIRKRILPRFAEENRQQLLEIGRRAATLNEKIDANIANYLHMQPARTELTRSDFIGLPHNVAREVLAGWLRANTSAELSKQMLERLIASAKTARSGSQTDVDANYWLHVYPTKLALKMRER